MIDKKEWKDFHSTGLLWFVNMVLHAFGWSIVFEWDGGEIVGVYPARVKFRGFSNEINTANYIKIAEYMNDQSEHLLKEAKE